LTVYNPSFFKNAIQIETVGRKSTWLMTSKFTRPNWVAVRWITKLPELSSCGRMPVFWLLHKSRRAKPTSSSGIHFSTITSDLIQFNCCILKFRTEGARMFLQRKRPGQSRFGSRVLTSPWRRGSFPRVRQVDHRFANRSTISTKWYSASYNIGDLIWLKLVL
jgi:hypothetical protein